MRTSAWLGVSYPGRKALPSNDAITRLGLSRPKPNGWGTLCLTTTGRRTGREAQGEERERLWARWREIDKNLDGYAARRSVQTAVVVLEPRLERA